MPQTKTIVCLAASRKHNGACFAGKDTSNKKWLRPVSSRQGEEISDAEAMTLTGRAALLDVLTIPILKPTPKLYQSENYLIDGKKQWTRVRKVTWAEVLVMVDVGLTTLWPNQDASWGYLNNRVLETAAKSLKSSLALLKPNKLAISVGPKGGMFEGANTRLVKAHFTLGSSNYILAVTDPAAEARYKNGPDGTKDITGAVVCVSLGEIFNGHAYKLVASVIEPF